MLKQLNLKVKKCRMTVMVTTIPALHYIAVTAQGAQVMDSTACACRLKQIDTVISWAKPINAF
jgi:hypothetical protein